MVLISTNWCIEAEIISESFGLVFWWELILKFSSLALMACFWSDKLSLRQILEDAFHIYSCGYKLDIPTNE